MIQIIMKLTKRNWSLHKKYLIQLMNIQLYLKTKHFWHLLDGVQLKKRYFYGPLVFWEVTFIFWLQIFNLLKMTKFTVLTVF
ncbi:hypothetical protein BCV72DRAFT_122832 [Rhizopus microsporus var. microsporus]|uniref:Uncharacterized protein n=1 Tax=Rhizopus microsporus var. microsporus TaxID=86635 RepID=A0A1X0RGF4_RHIZD|nr:hypothetical protein BCV72DRAFT_122832 [Rhizopus microsporus var. microsporus]